MDNTLLWSGLLTVLSVVLYVAFKISSRQDYISKRRELWQRLAQQHNAKLVLSPHFMMEKQDYIDFNLSGCILRLTHTYFAHRATYYQTSIITLLSPQASHDKTAQIYPEGITSLFASLLGAQDLELGHQEFDARFVVKSNDPAWLRSRINEDLIKEHLLFENTSVSLTDKTLKLSTFLGGTTEEEFSALLRLTSMYAKALLTTSSR